MTTPKHSRESYFSKIRQILETNETYGWEETSLSYTILSAYDLRGGVDAILLYNFESRVLLGRAEQYLSQFSGIKITEKINVDESEIFATPEGISTFTESIAQTKKIIINIFDTLYFNNIYKKTSGLSKDALMPIKFLKTNSLYLKFPFLRKIGVEIREFVSKNLHEISNLLDKLQDIESCEILVEIIRAAVTHDYYRLNEGNQVNKYFDCYKHISDEVVINCGAGTGDTIVKYFKNNYDCKKIYAIEGSGNIYTNLLIALESLPENIKCKIRPINKFIGVEKNSILSLDSLFYDKGATLINMDIEGAEKAVLEGGLQLIRKYRPVLAICAYHKASDLLDIPNLVLLNVDDYEIYLRKYKGYEPNALNEYVYYFVPKERSLISEGRHHAGRNAEAGHGTEEVVRGSGYGK